MVLATVRSRARSKNRFSPPSGGFILKGASMVSKKDLKKAIKDLEKEESKKSSKKKPPSLKERVNRIAEGNDPRYYLQ